MARRRLTLSTSPRCTAAPLQTTLGARRKWRDGRPLEGPVTLVKRGETIFSLHSPVEHGRLGGGVEKSGNGGFCARGTPTPPCTPVCAPRTLPGHSWGTSKPPGGAPPRHSWWAHHAVEVRPFARAPRHSTHEKNINAIWDSCLRLGKPSFGTLPTAAAKKMGGFSIAYAPKLAICVSVSPRPQGSAVLNQEAVHTAVLRARTTSVRKGRSKPLQHGCVAAVAPRGGSPSTLEGGGSDSSSPSCDGVLLTLQELLRPYRALCGGSFWRPGALYVPSLPPSARRRCWGR
jgi:hypothetical protein